MKNLIESLKQSGQLDALNNIPNTSSASVINVFYWVYGVVGLIAAGYIVYAGIMYVTAYGDPNKIQKAKQGLTFSIIGLIVVLLAAAITAFVTNIALNK